ncbi:MAG: hypothetical protein FJ221_09005 [Lentisphaerae bacterium]|nr:hypothetical protein [Lentisphaerota bacterium]
MKFTDDPRAKIRIRAAGPRVVPAPRFPGHPGFRSRRFDSHGELNAWKRDRIPEFARRGV